MWEYYYHSTPLKAKGKIASYVEQSNVWASGKLPTHRWEGKNQVSNSWAASTLPLFKDYFSP